MKCTEKKAGNWLIPEGFDAYSTGLAAVGRRERIARTGNVSLSFEL